MRRVILLMSLVAVVGAAPSRTKKSIPLTAMTLKCVETEMGGWRMVGSGSQNVTFEYWASGGCKAKIVGTSSIPGAPQITSPEVTAGPVHHDSFQGLVSADFFCRGKGGDCYFRVRDAATPGSATTYTAPEEPNVGYECNTTEDKTIFERGQVPCDIVVRVQAPKDCTATVKANTGAEIQLKNTTKFVGFAGASKISVRCEGSSPTDERCKFELRAWCH